MVAKAMEVRTESGASLSPEDVACLGELALACAHDLCMVWVHSEYAAGVWRVCMSCGTP